MNAIFWNATPCGSYKNRRLGETYYHQHQSDGIGELETLPQ
jgi:hypothetical protein